MEEYSQEELRARQIYSILISLSYFPGSALKDFILSHDTGQEDVTKLLTFTKGRLHGSCFHTAVLQEHKKYVDFLIQLGVFCSAEILSLACSKGNLAIVRYLIEDAGADPNQPDSRGKTPLMTACELMYMEIVRYLVEEVKVAVNKEVEGATALSYARYPAASAYLRKRYAK